jgi:hypothetical protein
MLLMPLGLAFYVIAIVVLVVKVVALIDCLRRPPAVFVSMEKQTKQFWTIVLVAAVLVTPILFLSIIGLVAAIVYLVDVRPAINPNHRY